MTKDKNDSPLTPDPEYVQITREELEELKRGKSDIEKLANSLASAIQESRKPYVSPEQEQNEQQARDSMRKQAEGQRRQREWDQKNCPHIMACNPLSSTRDMFGRSSFIKHRLDTGAEILLCTNCQKVVWPDDPDYVRFYNMHTTNVPSASGNRPHIRDVESAMNAGRL
jgi:hypothetical protein